MPWAFDWDLLTGGMISLLFAFLVRNEIRTKRMKLLLHLETLRSDVGLKISMVFRDHFEGRNVSQLTAKTIRPLEEEYTRLSAQIRMETDKL